MERLGRSGITLALIQWQTRGITGTPSYTPYNVTLDTGNEYANAGDGEITKIVFHTTNPERTYVGASSTAGGAIEFVTLPGTGNVASADIYTAGGLLLSTDVTSGYNKESLSFALPLSAAGMLPVNPTLAYGESNPYLVTTPVQFRNINNDPGKYYRQGTTLDMSTIITEDTDPPFTGITNFSGTYDGNGYWISEVMVQGAGLFNSNSGTLRNHRILTGTIDATGINIAGALCGSNTGTIAACINEAQVINAVNTAGGICGANSGSIIACLNTGNVSGGIIEGGICGTNSRDAEGVIKACVNTGMLARNTTVTNMGTICGTSIASAANIIRSSYGLVGSAAAYVGDTEVPVDSPGVGIYNCAILDPPAMKNQITAGEGETDRVIYKLNTELAADVNWKSAYQFVSDPVTTGILWPVPVKKP